MPTPCDLAGRGVLVTRPRAQAAGLCQLIMAAGGRAIAFPTIEIEAAGDQESARRLLAEPADLLCFTSRNAVDYALTLFPGGVLPTSPRLAAVGKATAEALTAAGRAPALVPEGRYDSEALLALPELQDLGGLRAVIVRGEGGRPLLGETLRARGAEVAYAEVYRRALPEVESAVLLAGWEREVQFVTATSGEILDNLMRILGEAGRERLLATPLAVVSAHTGLDAERMGFMRVELAERADDPALVQALCRLAA
ncbi:MAG: uroporphyrinogen-III synthase [Chromatiaceae bacterium]